MISYKELQALLQPDQEAILADQNAQRIKAYILILSHKQLRKIPIHIPSKEYAITRLDLSYNYFKDVKQLKEQPNPHLQYLNLSFNFLTSIDNFGQCFSGLKILDVNANRIESVDVRQKQFPVLQALYLKNNKIKFFLYCPNNVQILCLDHNQLSELAFEGGDSLEILSASSNQVHRFELNSPQGLAYLDLEQNKISDFQQVQAFLSKCPNLLSVNMIDNYVSKIAHKKYIIMVLTACSKVVKIDEVIINPHVRQAFRILKEQEDMEQIMKETQDKYRKRMEEQLKLKELMLDKLKNQEKEVQEKFRNYLKQQKQQLDSLQGYAKHNLGKKKFNIPIENAEFKERADGINKSSEQNSSDTDDKIPNQMANLLVKGIIDEHKEGYQQFIREQNESRAKNSSRQSHLRKYLGLNPSKQSLHSIDGKDEDSELSNEELDDKEIERRKRNMRNPSLIYRNSNQLIGLNNVITDMKADEEEIVNKKCLPYLVKNYGFHTVV